MKRATWMLAALALLLGGRGQVRADFIYDTTSSWDGANGVGPFGVTNTTTYGQTFIAPAGPYDVLNSFTFYIKGSVGVHLSMKAYVFDWSGSLFGGNAPEGATGTALYASPSSIIYNGDGSFEAVTVNTGGTTLTSGSHYVALLTISNPSDFNASTGTAVWGSINSHVANDGGGGFNFYNNGNNFGELNTTSWDDFRDFGDSAWKADFTAGPSLSPVPEPSRLILLGTGVLCLGGFTWCRRNRTSVSANGP